MCKETDSTEKAPKQKPQQSPPSGRPSNQQQAGRPSDQSQTVEVSPLLKPLPEASDSTSGVTHSDLSDVSNSMTV